MKPDSAREARIRHLVLETDDLIVFVDKAIDVDWETSDVYDAKGHKDPDKFYEIVNSAALLESTPCDHLSDKNKLNFKRLLGEAIARALEHYYDRADNALNAAETYIRDRNLETSRLWYISASGLTACLFAIIGFIMWSCRGIVQPMIGQTGFYSLLAATAGSLGALLSISLRIGNSKVDCAAGKELHYTEGALRVISGMISAFFIALCINAGILVPLFNNIGKTHIAMLIGGLVAGASERWVPSLIEKIQSDKKTDAKGPDG